MNVYLLIDKEKNVVAVYSSKDLAVKMKKPIETKFNVELMIDERTVDLDLSKIGLFR